ncbi:hypothetical protein F52700_3800 [Fusarium sp. NRRL 52700]|nr:hypothetical protein F52700_3800 [Fusarium sp. NRRL 52700]
MLLRLYSRIAADKSRVQSVPTRISGDRIPLTSSVLSSSLIRGSKNRRVNVSLDFDASLDEAVDEFALCVVAVRMFRDDTQQTVVVPETLRNHGICPTVEQKQTDTPTYAAASLMESRQPGRRFLVYAGRLLEVWS